MENKHNNEPLGTTEKEDVKDPKTRAIENEFFQRPQKLEIRAFISRSIRRTGDVFSEFLCTW